MHVSRESDSPIVPKKSSNGGEGGGKEAGRGGRRVNQARFRTLGRESLNLALARIRQATSTRLRVGPEAGAV